jgi:hypothetical protein
VGADPAGLAHRVENPPYGFDVGVFAPTNNSMSPRMAESPNR